MMVSRTRMLARFVALFAVVFPVMSSLVAAQVERTIYGFGAIPNDGSSPNGDLIVDRKGNLYGTTAGGGQYNYGTVFKLMPKTSGGWAETILYNFAGTPDGAYPSGGVIFDAAGNLYGATNYGGANVNSFTSGGTVYELSPPKKGGSQWTETILFDFSSSNAGVGGNPSGKLLFDSVGNLYGAAGTGGNGDADFCGDTGCGTIFQLQPASVGSWICDDIHDFLVPPKSDGYGPTQVVMAPDGMLYGYTNYGGEWISKLAQYQAEQGGVFRLDPPNGGGQWPEQLLYLSNIYGAAGQYPAGLIFGDNGALILTMSAGGNFGDGAVTELTPAEGGEVWNANLLYSFTGGADGNGPRETPFRDSSGNIYVTTAFGGANVCSATGNDGCGTLIKLTPNGDGTYSETTIYEFSQSVGGLPHGGLLLHQGFLVGAAAVGGAAQGSGNGTIYEIQP